MNPKIRNILQWILTESASIPTPIRKDALSVLLSYSSKDLVYIEDFVFSQSQVEELKNLAREGKIIQAVKLLRGCTGTNIEVAKRFFDRHFKCNNQDKKE